MRVRSLRRVGAAITAALMMTVLIPTVAQAAVPECTDTVDVRMSGGGLATLPARAGSVNCYLQQRNPVQQQSGTILLQQALSQCHGFFLDADGYYGAATTAAVKSFQRSRGLTADGVYGAQTRAAMSWPTGIFSVDPACQRM